MVPDEEAGEALQEVRREGIFQSVSRQELKPTSCVSLRDFPITLSWKDVDVWTARPSDTSYMRHFHEPPKKLRSYWCCGASAPTHIVRHVSGIAKPGELVAMLGASGAGKTTLLNFLACRNKGLYTRGSRCINGIPATPDDVSAISAYIEQEDFFFGALTVKEHLTFNANLRFGKDISEAEKKAKILSIMIEFGLTKCANTQVGFPGRIQGISGGESKRLALASEILWDPQLLICDEPTTGLDIFMAINIITQLKKLSSKNKTIICTIHQPSIRIFKMFDRVILLAEGRVAFSGTLLQCVEFFTSQGYACPPDYNLADHIVHTLAVSPTRSPTSLKKVEDICNAFLQSPAYAELGQDLSEDGKRATRKANLKARLGYQVSWLKQFTTVFRRSLRCIIGDPLILPVRLFQTIFIALLIGGVYFHKGKNMETSYDNFVSLSGLLFLIVANISIQYVYCALDGFQAEVPLFLKEHFNGMYRVDVYYCAKQLADFPLYVIFPFIFTLIIYLMVGFSWADFQAPFITLSVSFLVAFCSGSYGYFISAATPNLNIALVYGASLLIPMMLYGGFTVRPSALKSWNSWARYTSWYWYADEAIMTYQLKPYTIREGNFTSKFYLVHEFEYYENHLIGDIFGLLGISLVFRILAFLALYGKTFRK